MLNQETAIPLYLQLKTVIKEEIEQNILKIGDRISSENELCNKYDVSRITVRNALSELVSEGYLVKKQGKGTFVSKPKMSRSIQYTLGFTESCENNGLSSTSIVNKKEIIIPSEDIKKILELDDDDKVIYIQRVRYAGGEPLMVENNYYSYKKFIFLLNEDLSGSIYKLLKDKFNIEYIKSKKSTLTVTKADFKNSSILNIDSGEPLFVMENTIVDQNDKILYTGKDFIIGSRYSFDLSGNIGTNYSNENSKKLDK